MSNTAMNTTSKPKLVVIGNGMVGHHFVERAIEQGLHERFEIHVFAEEDQLINLLLPATTTSTRRP